MYDFGIVTKWLDDWMNGFMPGWLTTTIECVLVAVGLLVAYSLIAMFYIFYERKVCGWIQCRLGPMRVGKWGLLQVFADVIKIVAHRQVPVQARALSGAHRLDAHLRLPALGQGPANR